MDEREFVFEIREIKKNKIVNGQDEHIQVLSSITGLATVEDGEVKVYVNDARQPQGFF